MSRLVHWLPLSLAFNCVPRSAGSEFETTWQTQVEQRTRLPENSAKRVHYGNDGGSIFICLFDYAFMVKGSVANICKSNLRLKRENKCSLQDISPFSLFFSGVLFCKKSEKNGWQVAPDSRAALAPLALWTAVCCASPASAGRSHSPTLSGQ